MLLIGTLGGAIRHSVADEASELRTLATQFFATQAKKDLPGHLALWSASAQGLGEYRTALQKLLDQNIDIQVKRTTILRQKIERATATVQVYSELTSADKSGRPSNDFGKRATNLTCAREGGAWKITRASEAVRDLLDGLLTAVTRPERQTLLFQDRPLLGAEIVITLNQRAEAAAREKNLPEALRVNDLAYEVAGFLEVKALLGTCWTSRGLIHAAVGKTTEAMENYRRALTELRDAKDKVSESLVLNYMGVLQLNEKKNAEASKLFEQSLELLRSLNNKPLEALVLTNLAATHERLDNPAAAVTAYQNAITALRFTTDRVGEARLNIVVGNLQRKLKNEREALAAYGAAQKLYRDLGNKAGEADVLMGIGAVLSDLGDKQKASESFDAALALIRGGNDKRAEAITLNNLATTQEQLKNYPAALTAFVAAVKLFNELGDKVEESRVLVALGNVQRTAKRLPDAQASYEAALKLKRELMRPAEEANLLLGIGAVLYEMGERQKAAVSFDDALKLIRSLNDRAAEATALMSLGLIHDQSMNPAAALTAYEGAAGVYRELKDKLGESRALVAVGNLQSALQKPDASLKAFETALALKRELNDKSAEANLLVTIGRLQYNAKEPQKAAASFAAALTLVRAEKNQQLEAVTLSNLGGIEAELKHPAEALKLYEASAKLFRELADKEAEARALINIGNLQVELKRPTEAVAAYEAALKLRREQKDTAGEANLLIALGAMYHNHLKDTKRAAATFETALKLVRDSKQRDVEAGVLSSYAAMLERMEKNDEALKAYADSVAAFREVGDKALEARTLVNLGNLQNKAGKGTEALASYESALKFKQELKDRPGEVDLLMGLGLIYHRQNNVAKATTAWETGLAIARDLNLKPLQAAAQLNLATVYEQTDSLIPALAAYDEVLRLARELKDAPNELRALVGLGNTQRSLRSLGGALKSFDEGLALAGPLKDHDNEFRCRLGKALILTSQARWAEARVEYRHTLAVLNAFPLGLQTIGPARTLTLGDRRALRDNLTLTALQLQTANAKPEGNDAKAGATFLELAFAESDARRIHSFVDLAEVLGATLADGAPAAQTARARELAQQHGQQLRELSILGGQPGPRDDETTKKLAELETKLKSGEQQMAALVATLRETKYGKLRYPEPSSVAEARKLLPANGALLSYHVMAEQTMLYVVTRTGLGLKAIPLSRVALSQKVSALLTKMADGKSDLAEVATVSSELYAALVGPAAAELKGLKRLLIVPDGPLCYLPFAALVAGKDAKGLPTYMIDEYTISTVPSLSALLASRETRPKTRPVATRSLTAFADPELPAKPASKPDSPAANGEGQPTTAEQESLPVLQFGASEANSAAALFKPKDKVYLGKEASEEHAKDDTAGSRLLLFATPVRLGDDQLGELLPLAKGALNLSEVLSLKLNTDLVVLSGGHAVPGKLVTGDSLHLLTRGFMHAGANSVAVSLWRVNDASRSRLTQGLLSELKTQMAGPGLDKAEALRTAQLKLRKAAPTAHPFHWAAFTLAGDWQ